MKYAGAVKRFGTRYGVSTKKKLSKIEVLRKGKKECPFCRYKAVKWVAVGIWLCGKCGKKFTGKAYTITKEIPVEETEEPEETTEEKKE